MSGHIANEPQHQACYNASKAGVLHLTRSLAAEWADLQGAVVYLASAASDFVTGADIVIDGGYCCW